MSLRRAGLVRLGMRRLGDPNTSDVPPSDATYWVRTADAALPNAYALSGITGLVKSTAGVPSQAVAGTDYAAAYTLGVGQVAFATSANQIGGESTFVWDSTNDTLKLGGSVGTPSTAAAWRQMVLDSGVLSTSYGFGVEASNLWLHTASGLKIYSAGTNYATMDSTGRWTFGGSTTPRYPIDVTGTASSQIHFASNTADSGAYLISLTAHQAFIGAGVSFTGGQWVAKSTVAALFQVDGGNGLIFYTNSGLTAGVAFAPTELARFTVASSRISLLFATSSAANIDFGANAAVGGPSSFSNWRVIAYNGGTTSGSYGLGVEGGYLWFNSGGATNGYKFYVANSEIARFDNLDFYLQGGVERIKDATTVPSVTPTGGGIEYSQGGSQMWLSSSGILTMVAP